VGLHAWEAVNVDVWVFSCGMLVGICLVVAVRELLNLP
jgi:hypothetical protein